ncbi:hypothetical protein [Acinetobacter sp. WZC-1]|uniref:hypothetical protein n=1 Tax=Acinetobacter sp. WZC-1 TaxID=3459034 RepID=UPI00403D9053
MKRKDEDIFLIINNHIYPSINYYDDVKLKAINANYFQVINNYSEKSPVTIYSTFVYQKGVVKIYSIKTISYPNISPQGDRQECNILINRIFERPLLEYIDDKVFNLNEKQKLNLCVTSKN